MIYRHDISILMAPMAFFQADTLNMGNGATKVKTQKLAKRPSPGYTLGYILGYILGYTLGYTVYPRA